MSPTPSDDSVTSTLASWYRRPVGRALLRLLQEELRRQLPLLFGYHAVQMGTVTLDPALLSASRIRHWVIIGREARETIGLRADSEALPLAAESVDLVLIVHGLEFASSPHQLLREVERILVPEGHVLMITFNPWSWMGLRHLVQQRDAPWSGRFYLPTRVRDWLTLLGFELLEERRLFSRPVIQSEPLLRRLVRLDEGGNAGRFGAISCILARKRVVGMTSIRLRWRTPKLVPGLIKPISYR